MYGRSFTVAFGALIVIAGLVALLVLASPLFAVIVALFVLALIAFFAIARRGTEAVSGGGPAGGRDAYSGGPARAPRSGGEPVSGEGQARGGETAGVRPSAQ